MKKLTMFLFLMVFFVMPFPANAIYTAKIYTVYLHPSLDTGVTTSFSRTDPTSGASVLVLDGHGFTRGGNASVIDTRDMYGSWVFQMSGLTPCQAAVGSGNYSGVTFAVWMRTTLDTNMWDSGITYEIFDGTALSSSATPIPVDISPNSLWSGASTFTARAARLELFLSGITPMDGLTGTLHFLPWR